MKTEITNCDFSIFEVDLLYWHEGKDKGQWDIKCEVIFNSGKKILFSHRTTNSNFIAMIFQMKENQESAEELQDAYHDYFFNEFEQKIVNWREDYNRKVKIINFQWVNGTITCGQVGEEGYKEVKFDTIASFREALAQANCPHHLNDDGLFYLPYQDFFRQENRIWIDTANKKWMASIETT